MFLSNNPSSGDINSSNLSCSNYFRMASAERRATGEHSLSVYYRERFVAGIYSCACFKMILFTMHY